MSPPEKRAILTEQQVQQVLGAQGRIELDGGLYDFICEYRRAAAQDGEP